MQYSAICARVVRQALRSDLRVEAAKRDQAFIRKIEWKDGKAISKLTTIRNHIDLHFKNDSQKNSQLPLSKLPLKICMSFGNIILYLGRKLQLFHSLSVELLLS